MKLIKIGEVKANSRYEIRVDSEYKKAMKEIGDFSHLVVLWWADQTDSAKYRESMIVKKPYKNGPETIGIFATRSPVRANPICMSVVNVEEVDYNEGVIYTSYIDAEDGTPVLDIKPYYPCSDVVRDVKPPKWCEGLPKCIEDSASFDWSNYFNF